MVIHIEDVFQFIRNGLITNTEGTFNMAANSESWRNFQNMTYDVLGDQFVKITIPSFMLKLFLLEMSSLFVDGNYVNSSKMEKHGSVVKYKDLQETLMQLKVQSQFLI